MTPPEFAEYAQIKEAHAQVAGELRGMVAAAEALPKKLAVLAALVDRALDQTESVTRQAAKLAAAAQARIALQTADRDAALAELAALRAAGRASLRDPAKP